MIHEKVLEICLEKVAMNNYDLIMKDIKATISKYMGCKLIVNPLFSEKKCTEFSISSNHNNTGIYKDMAVAEVYKNIRDNNDYLFMFHDGGFIQIEYRFERKMISYASLIYYPYPNEAIYDGYLDKMRTYIRLEYTNEEGQYTKISHPKAHMHIGNYNNLRLAVKRIPMLSEFMELVMYFNYHDEWEMIKDCKTEDELIRNVKEVIRSRRIMTIENCLEEYEEQYFSLTV